MKKRLLLIFNETKIQLFLLASVLFLGIPLFAFAACGDINSVGIFNFTIVALIIFAPFFLVNIDYLKMSLEDTKLFTLNFAPLIFFPVLSFLWIKFSVNSLLSPQEVFFKTLDRAVSFLFIYYVIFLVYGIYLYFNDEKIIGFDIIKFCISLIIAIAAVGGFLFGIMHLSSCV